MSVPVLAPVAQCVERVQFNWACYLCSEFLVNFRKAQDLSKSFHYVWLLLSIVQVAWELPKDNQFPSVVPELPKVVKYALQWATKDPQQIKNNKIFWILMEMNMHMAINRKPQFSSTVFDKLQEYVQFNADFHHVLIKG